MNYNDLKLRAATLAAQSGFREINPAPDWGSLINKALLDFSWRAEYCIGEQTVNTIQGTNEYALTTPPDWKRITDIVYNNTNGLTLTDENQLRRNDPAWLIAPNSPPQYFYVVRPNVVRVHPTPDSSSLPLRIRGIKADVALVNATDTPACPDTYSEGIALLACWHWCKLFAEADDEARVQGFYTEAYKYADDLKQYLAEQSAPCFQRKVKVPIPGRVFTGIWR